MPEIKSLYVANPRDENPVIHVGGLFRGAGEISVRVQLPKDFMDVINQFAQAALEKKEAEMKAALLTGEHIAENKGE